MGLPSSQQIFLMALFLFLLRAEDGRTTETCSRREIKIEPLRKFVVKAAIPYP
jgi:hypothetical protein